MIKIPLELYNKLTQTSTTDDFNGNFDEPQEIRPIKTAQQHMEGVIRNVGIPSDVKNLRYIQEFKRAQKLAREREEKPINVKVQNLSELSENLGVPSASSSSVPSTFGKRELEDEDESVSTRVAISLRPN